MPTAIIFDIEATDKDNPVLIEAAWIALESISPFTLGEGFHQRYNPGKPISLGALATHHILDEELVDCPPASSFKLPSDAVYLIGHNIDFDWAAIGQPDIKRICTLALARKAWPSLDSHSQSALLYFVDRANAREKLRSAHSAEADIRICATLLEHLCRELNITSLEALWQASEHARLPSHMTFGKHKGLPLNEVPKDYVRWLLDQPNVDTYVKQAFMAISGKKH
jgi:exodeoxyribonuclease X